MPDRRSPLDAAHRALGAKMVPFAGWEMPVQYPSGILAEHQPRVVFFPHEADWNSTHIGTHLLVVDALARLGPDFPGLVVETGSAHGGSALYFADLLELAAAPETSIVAFRARPAGHPPPRLDELNRELGILAFNRRVLEARAENDAFNQLLIAAAPFSFALPMRWKFLLRTLIHVSFADTVDWAETIARKQRATARGNTKRFIMQVRRDPRL